ncbi:DNRLRE domain-containing protein [Chloroflexota bacterium]
MNIYLPVLFNNLAHNPPGVLPTSPRVNVPYFDGEINLHFAETAILWFGQVTPTENYADVRVGYNQDELWVYIAVVDRRLWYDPNPSVEELALWDAATLYLDLNGNPGEKIGGEVYRFVGQLNWWEPREEYQVAYRNTGSEWQIIPFNFTTNTSWWGLPQPNDDKDDRGWAISFRIPFQNLDLPEKPTDGTLWRMAIQLHDRDDAAGTPILDKTWPPAMEANHTNSWGNLRFSLPVYTPPEGANPDGTVTIRHGLNGATVVDGMAGGQMGCGWPLEYWTNWGQANYQGTEQVNVQNEFDISDWPCFSKYYLTFPLDSLPPGKEIISATLTLTSVGNAGMGEWGPPGYSVVQVLTVGQDWDEATLNWNNAPLALENVSRTLVEPIPEGSYPPGKPHKWDLSYAVNQAYSAGIPLRLALYSADYDYNTGRYFAASETGDAIQEYRPTLDVVWGDP